MPKQYNIRWGRSDYSKLSHLVRKVNKKILNIEVKRPDIAGYQPSMLDYQNAKAQIKTRQDFNNFINKYERYLRDGVEEVERSVRGAKASLWEINEFNIAQRAENVRRANTRKRLGEMEVKIGGKGTGVKRSEMGSIKENEAKPSRKKFKNMSQEEWKRAFVLMEKKMRSDYDVERKQHMIENYIKGLINEGYSDELLQILNKVPLDKFMEVIDTDEVASFDFIYDPIELRGKQERLIELWSQYANEDVNHDVDFNQLRM